MAALDQAPAPPHCPFEGTGRVQAVEGLEVLGVQKGEPGQHAAVEPVGLGVLGVVVPQVGGPFGGD